MLSYQHGYHAGNPADIHKHFTLWAVTRRLQQKPAAIHFFDTHAGRGWYDLHGPQAQKNGEFREGVERLLSHRDALEHSPIAELWQSFFGVLDAAHGHPVAAETLQFYPGSPAWVSALRREQDRHTVFELHPTELSELNAVGETRTGRVIYGDGLKGVVQQLPPQTPRLVILIDPAYENKEEYGAVAETVAKALKRCRHAVILVWYPLLPARRHEAMLADMQQGSIPCLRSEFVYKPEGAVRGMYGSGMLIFNPPWQLDSQLRQAFLPVQELYSLADGKAPQNALHHVDWLVSDT